MKGSKAISSLLKTLGGDYSDDILRAGIKNAGYEATEKMIKPIDGLVDLDKIAGEVRKLSSPKPKPNAIKNTALNPEQVHSKRQRDLEEVFNNAEKVGGDGDTLYVDKNSKILKRQKELEETFNNAEKVGDDDNAIYVGADSKFSESRKAFLEKQKEIEKWGNTPTSELKGEAYKTKTGYRRFMGASSLEDAMKEVKSGNLEGKKISDFIDRYKKTNPDLDITADQLKSLASDENKYKTFRGGYLNNMDDKDFSLSETMGFYKIPQKATGVAGTLWLVNKLASNGGQQSNAQLYGQQPY